MYHTILDLFRRLFLKLLLNMFVKITEETKKLIDSDVEEMNRRCGRHNKLDWYLIHERPYRNLFYYRVPKARRLRFFFPEYSLFHIGVKEAFGSHAFVLNHPYGTIINAKSIGSNFTICQLTTIGNKRHGDTDAIPTIGNNVSLGANVTIIGDIKIGNNVIIGAGSVVVSDIPDNSVAVGVPAVVVKTIH